MKKILITVILLAGCNELTQDVDLQLLAAKCSTDQDLFALNKMNFVSTNNICEKDPFEKNCACATYYKITKKIPLSDFSCARVDDILTRMKNEWEQEMLKTIKNKKRIQEIKNAIIYYNKAIELNKQECSETGLFWRTK